MNFLYLKPYHVESSTDNVLKIFEPPFRRFFLFMFYRIFPLSIIFSTIFIIISFEIPLKLQFLLALVPLLIFVILLKKYVLSVKISSYSICIAYNSLFKKVIEEYKNDNIEEIFVDTYYISRGGGYFYFLLLKENNRKIPILTIPFIFMKEKNKELINSLLTAKTGLCVKDKGIF